MQCEVSYGEESVGLEGRTQQSPDLVRGNRERTWWGGGNHDCVRMTNEQEAPVD